jgi:pimeloyl-ACP methyl ester carboxylesterase
MTEVVYYLPGYRGQLATGLGQALLSRGFDVTGRETRGDFDQLTFADQVHTVANDLQQHFWSEQARVVANSFGAYLFLHAQSRMPAYPGRVLLLSPIVGQFQNDESGLNFIPPFAECLRGLVQLGKLPSPRTCEVHVGEEDWQSMPANVMALGEALSLQVHIVQRSGHMLDIQYVSVLLDRWL